MMNAETPIESTRSRTQDHRGLRFADGFIEEVGDGSNGVVIVMIEKKLCVKHKPIGVPRMRLRSMLDAYFHRTNSGQRTSDQIRPNSR